MLDILSNRIIRENDAVMFDIDDTLIFTNGKANKPIIDLVHYSKNLGYKVIIMTARPDLVGIEAFTRYQLRMYDIPYDRLFLTPAENKGNLKRISGYNYILSVGDMDTDLTDTEYKIKISSEHRNLYT